MQQMLPMVATKELDIQKGATVAEELAELVGCLEAAVEQELRSVESVEAPYSRHQYSMQDLETKRNQLEYNFGAKSFPLESSQRLPEWLL